MSNTHLTSGPDEELALKMIRSDLNAILQSEGKINYSMASLKDARSAKARAYLGLLKSTSAGFATWPTEKLKRFNEGKQMIEQAIETSGAHPEVRLIRLMVQCNCPSFLGYTSRISEDTRQIMAALRGNQLSDAEKKFIAEKLLMISCVKEPLKSELRKILPT